MENKVLDASPKKKGFQIPTEPVARRNFYLDLMKRYQASNPVKFEDKREELQKKADGYVYTFDPVLNRTRWMLVYPVSGKPETVLGAVPKTTSEQEVEEAKRAGNELESLRKRVADLEDEKVKAAKEAEDEVDEDEEDEEPKAKPKGRPKKVK